MMLYTSSNKGINVKHIYAIKLKIKTISRIRPKAWENFKNLAAAPGIFRPLSIRILIPVVRLYYVFIYIHTDTHKRSLPTDIYVEKRGKRRRPRNL